MHRWKPAVVLVTGMISLLWAGEIRAQEVIDIQRFEPALDRHAILSTEGAEVGRPYEFQVGLVINYARNPRIPSLKIGEPTGPSSVSLFSADFTASVTFAPFFSVGVGVPGHFYLTNELFSFSGDQKVQAGAGGLGDVRLNLKFALLKQEDYWLNLALIPQGTFPTANGMAGKGPLGEDITGPGAEGRKLRNLLGEDDFTYGAILALSRHFDDLHLAANLGYRYRKDRGLRYGDAAGAANPCDELGAPDLCLSDEIIYRLALDYYLEAARLDLMAEVGGTTDAGRPFRDSLPNPMEGLAGLRYHPTPHISLMLAGGGRVMPGLFTPDWRVVVGFAFSVHDIDSDGDGIYDSTDRCPGEPEDTDGFEDLDGCPELDNDGDGIEDRYDKCRDIAEDVDHFQDEDGCPDPDNDRDGIPDTRDKCPGLPEDVDDYQDEDGCPDLDRDLDGIPDALDKCPTEAEDKDGFEDEDGCPDLDHDHDGVLDTEDKCPADPEDRDGFQDEDGCPDLDNDKDGVPDTKDNCPLQPEDKDDFQDKDGCPDLDNDKDGIADLKDKCPNKPETQNGYQDEDGCPDEAPKLVEIKKGKIEIKEKIFFRRGKASILPRSYPVLDQVVALLKEHPTIKKLIIEGHTDSRGSRRANFRISQRRAEAVELYLIERGIDPARLEAVGYGESKPIAPNSTRAGRMKNRRVEFRIKQ